MNQFTYVLDTRINQKELDEMVYHIQNWITSPKDRKSVV